MKKDKSPIVVEVSSNDDKAQLLTPSNSQTKNTETSSSQQFLKLAKQFAIDAALLPTERQIPIEERANKRGRLTALRKQQNIENIIQKTLGYCANLDIKQRTDHDWFDCYITLAEGVSNQTMQDLWAKILAGELVKPGSFSFKALKIFREMSIYDAKLLAKACSLAVQDQNKKNIRLISGTYQKPGLWNFFSKQRQQYINLSHFGLNYADLLALAENHLIYLQESELNLDHKDEKLNFYYNGLPLKFSAKRANTCLQFYKFTPLGAELAYLISDKPNNDFFTNLKKQLSCHFNILA